MRRRKKQFGNKLHGRSKITNGRALLPSIDGRSLWSRRFRDLNGSFASDLGHGQDDSAMSEGQRALVRRASALCVELELLEVRFARDGGAKVEELDVFQRATNSLRRLCESLGIHQGRIARDITPTLDQYLAEPYPKNEAT
jgi:hypothetical protein